MQTCMSASSAKSSKDEHNTQVGIHCLYHLIMIRMKKVLLDLGIVVLWAFYYGLIQCLLFQHSTGTVRLQTHWQVLGRFFAKHYCQQEGPSNTQ